MQKFTGSRLLALCLSLTWLTALLLPGGLTGRAIASSQAGPSACASRNGFSVCIKVPTGEYDYSIGSRAYVHADVKAPAGHKYHLVIDEAALETRPEVVLLLGLFTAPHEVMSTVADCGEVKAALVGEGCNGTTEHEYTTVADVYAVLLDAHGYELAQSPFLTLKWGSPLELPQVKLSVSAHKLADNQALTVTAKLTGDLPPEGSLLGDGISRFEVDITSNARLPEGCFLEGNTCTLTFRAPHSLGIHPGSKLHEYLRAQLYLRKTGVNGVTYPVPGTDSSSDTVLWEVPEPPACKVPKHWIAKLPLPKSTSTKLTVDKYVAIRGEANACMWKTGYRLLVYQEDPATKQRKYVLVQDEENRVSDGFTFHQPTTREYFAAIQNTKTKALVSQSAPKTVQWTAKNQTSCRLGPLDGSNVVNVNQGGIVCMYVYAETDPKNVTQTDPLTLTVPIFVSLWIELQTSSAPVSPYEVTEWSNDRDSFESGCEFIGSHNDEFQCPVDGVGAGMGLSGVTRHFSIRLLKNYGILPADRTPLFVSPTVTITWK